ncbi:MAG: hypothetical protein K5919_02065 [Clostridiales bacterium]|nr:hypothetical protein [Clostridiales bacterium]
MALVLIVLYVIGITPLRLSARVQYPGAGPPRVCLRAWGVRLPPGKKPLAGGIGGLRGKLPALRAILKHVTVRRLEIRLRVGGDAARAALITGFVRGVAGLVPRAGIRCDPGFGETGALRAECILDARLGILLAAALAGRFARKARRKKEAAA